MSRLAIVLLALSLLASLSPPRAGIAGDDDGACVLYGADGASGGSSNLYVINPANGAVIHLVGPIGFAITGLAFDSSSGTLYGSTSVNSATAPASLVRINPATGTGTLVGPFGATDAPGQSMADLAFRGRGNDDERGRDRDNDSDRDRRAASRLYGWSSIGGDLYTINLATGTATKVGESGLGQPVGSGLVFGEPGRLDLAEDFDTGHLRTINPATGLPTGARQLTGGNPANPKPIGALTLDSRGTLVGTRINRAAIPRTAELIAIDPSTAAITVRGQTVPRLDAIEAACSGRSRD
jgi:hypothetical protein